MLKPLKLFCNILVIIFVVGETVAPCCKAGVLYTHEHNHQVFSLL